MQFKMTVVAQTDVWQSSDGKVTIYTIKDDQGREWKTMSQKIGTGIGQVFDVESYVNAKGNTYIRQQEKQPQAAAPQSQGGAKEYKADPVKQESIEWQACLKAAVDAVRDFHTFKGDKVTDLASYKKEIGEALVTFTQTIKHKPNTITPTQAVIETLGGEVVEDEAQGTVELPPVEVYEKDATEYVDESGDVVLTELEDEPKINLDDIPF